MRKLLMTLAILGGVAFGASAPASATAAGGLAVKPAAGIVAPSTIDQVRWRGGWGHRRFGYGFGFGAVPGLYGYYGGYPYYGYRRHYYRPYWRHRGYRHHRYWRRW